MVYFLVSSSKKQTTLPPLYLLPPPPLRWEVVWFSFCLGILYDGIFNEFTFSSVSHSICICVCILVRGVCLGLSCGLTAYIFSKKIYYIKNVHKMKGVNLFKKLSLPPPPPPPTPSHSAFFLFCSLLLASGNWQRCSR